MRQFFLIPIFCLFCVGLSQESNAPATQAPSQTAQSPADKLAEDTKWVLDNFNSFLAKFDAIVASGKQLQYTKEDTQILALINKKAVVLAGQWQAVFDSYGAAHSVNDALEKNPRYEKALILAQEMTAISGASEANLALPLKPHYYEEMARNAIDYMGIVRRMETIR
ncbi:MAG TPA: hypothetical protein VGL56_00325 [Fimbriimonadaceae bacterium]|jgi:hypothetical protein